MKVAQVSHAYLPHLGGIEFYVRRLIEDSKKAGINSEVLTTDLDTPEEGRKKEAKYFRTSFSFMRNPFSFELRDYLKNNSFDVIHLHNVWFLPSLMATFYRKNAKVITTMHGVYPDEASISLRFFLKLYKPLAKYVLNKSEKIIVLSNSEKEKLINIFKISPKKIMVIPNGIRIEEYKRVKKEGIVLFTGRIIQDKNPDLLIRASALINKDFKLLFVGPIENSYKKKLLELADNLRVKNKIMFHEPISIENRNELMNIYKKSKIFVSLGSWEGLPTRLMEAMQFEVPCIAYSSGGSSELIKDGYNGFVISKLDEKQLSDKLEKLLENKKLAEKLGKNARKTIKENFDWNKVSKKILEVYKE